MPRLVRFSSDINMPHKDRFECVQCGDCCRRIGKNSKEKASTEDEIILVLDEGTIEVFEWELERLKSLASKKGINLAVSPCRVVYDTRGDVKIVLTWAIDFDVCPFLSKNNLCTIYENRPSICRAFPILDSNILDIMTGRKKSRVVRWGKCNHDLKSEEILSRIGNSNLHDYFEYMYSRYGQMFLANLEMQNIDKDIIEFVKFLCETGVIRPINKSQVNEAVLRNKRSKSVSIGQMYGLFEKEELFRKMVDGYEDMSFAKNIVHKVMDKSERC
jgi:Fe-S-cluster containining protein